ncbi:cobaltochelatase subunit CobN, partial [Cyanobium sp. HWJ4-Hawea]|uniref:cobaltochelatase subunit CobN n=1 Tax=Cyanobium sp. HWJ4-Hawea TaxID=2823713 RepID=UPI0020CBDE8F
MHRLASIPGALDPADAGAFIEQPPAPVLLLSSADTDLVAIDRLLAQEPELLADHPLRGLNISALSHPAVLDHYISSTVSQARLVVVRLLGGRGHWGYGLEQLQLWAQARPNRQLAVLAGTQEEDQFLASIGTVPIELAIGLAACFRIGGSSNLRQALTCFNQLLIGGAVGIPVGCPQADPLPHDWRDEANSRVGVLAYRSLLEAGDQGLMDALLGSLRLQGLSPRGLWVSGLRDPAVQRGVADLLQREGVEAVLCTTSFASVQFEEAALGAPLWESLGVPVLQVLCSSQSREQWQGSSIGLGPIDLGLQVSLPELDGRITTRIGAFKESRQTSTRLATAMVRYEPDLERLQWISALTAAWIRLRQTPATKRRVALVLANYPTRNSRLANGVGLDTPASTALILDWLGAAGYQLKGPLPADGDALIHQLLQGLTNDPESGHRPAMARFDLQTYLAWYQQLPPEGRQRLEAVWGAPETDRGLVTGPLAEPFFPIRGLDFGHVTVLIQPERGYDRDPTLSYHSPDLPPTHAYLAQYLWLRQSFGAHVVVHVGKHGNLEWLPGKGLGLSNNCFAEWALGPMPHLYPFIVNDPGEGSQAKRRAQAVILDHLTPPLGRAGLHGELQTLEALLDEYWEAQQLGSERVKGLRIRLDALLASMELPPPSPRQSPGAEAPQYELDQQLDAADGYLCELKEAQIRLGLHTYGQTPGASEAAELLLCLARAPQPPAILGLTQALAGALDLQLDPWCDQDSEPLRATDRRLLEACFGECSLRLVGDAVALLEGRALEICQAALNGETIEPGVPPSADLAVSIQHLCEVLMPRLLACAEAEKQALLAALAGERIAAGPSGAPTRGRPDVLPTGRNFYSVDLRGLPTEAAWDLGRRSAELLLETHLQEEGEHLSHLALSVWGTATMRNGGEDIGQALALLGVRPVWDGPTRRMVDLELVPLSLLGRPRVDVTLRISGLFRDAFPQLVDWMNRATQLVAQQDEPENQNPLAASARLEGHSSRVYGSAPGAYGAGLQGLIDSGQWEQRSDLGEAFLNWSGWRYQSEAGGPIEATADRSGLEQRLGQVQVVLHNQDNREHDLLDSDDYYQFQGGLSAAAESLQGKSPAAWFGDHSRHGRPKMHRLERELDKVLRSRVLNPRWIGAMQNHGYKGGFEMAASLDYLFAYDASTGRAPDWGYGAICDQWLGDQSICDFLKRANPWALRDMAERLLEAHNRDLWQGAQKNQLEL